MSNTSPMTGSASNSSSRGTRRNSAAIVAAGLRRRYAAERRFRLYGISAIAFALICLAMLFATIIGNGHTAFLQTGVVLDVTLSAETIDPSGDRDPAVLARADYRAVVRQSLRARFPEVTSRGDKRKLDGLLSDGAQYDLRDMVLADPSLIGRTVPVWLVASDDVDMVVKGHVSRDVPEADRRTSDKELEWLIALEKDGRVEKRFNSRFFAVGDSREPELAGIRGALMGSLFTMVVTLLLSFPLGVATAIYLEEFARKTRWTQLIEVNINNLAAVPSIVFGLLGLAVFLNFFGMPRSAPIVGGVVLAIMTLPTVIIAGRAALQGVPPSIREAAYGIGASPMQVVFHHVLPLAMPGMLTGAIIGMARALGETAPLLMIGMVAFIVDVPGGFSDPSTVLPVQVYLWADSPERAFVERTSAAIIVLLAFLMAMNALAIFLRKKFERRW